MPVKKAKKSRKQKGRGDYPPTFDEWYASPMSENAKYRESIGDPSQVDDTRNWYLAKVGKNMINQQILMKLNTKCLNQSLDNLLKIIMLFLN